MIKILKACDIDEILLRNQDQTKAEIELSVQAILADVQANGDEAVIKYSKMFDKVDLVEMQVSEAEIDYAMQNMDKEYLDILEVAKANIEEYHLQQVRKNYELRREDGSVLGQINRALDKVGIYVPGGTASYPSTVLMNAIPAKIAGVSEIIMVTPPNSDGNIRKEVLCAAKIAGVDKIYKIGGAQAIGALAYGTNTISQVDKITGPGNIFVATAKKMVYGIVDIDMIAGPSEILIIADDSAIPKFVASDMLSQAEHDKLASSVLITTSVDLAEAVLVELEKQLKMLDRQDIARKSIDENGKIIIANSIDEAIDISNLLAPEHLELCVSEPFETLKLVKNAGSIFLGNYTPEALGDYIAGTNHTLPTSGTARFASPLSVDDYMKKSSYIYYTKQALHNIAPLVDRFARSEGLDGHANSVCIRLKEEQ